MFDLQSILIRAPGILLGLTIHEYAHGYVAYRRGDSTAYMAGRLSLNPLVHLDLLGTLMLLFGPFGWAKPVPVNANNLHNPRRDLMLVSAAGPAANIVCAGLLGIILRLCINWYDGSMFWNYTVEILQMAFLINIGLSFFNLLPIPPLDGSNIIQGFIPHAVLPHYYRYVRYIPMVFLALIVIEWAFHIPTISYILNPLFIPYFSFWKMLFLGGKVM
jgi:Zn-dependent protease